MSNNEGFDIVIEFCQRCQAEVEPRVYLTFDQSTEDGQFTGNYKLKAECSICNRYIKFLPQSQEILKQLNGLEII